VRQQGRREGRGIKKVFGGPEPENGSKSRERSPGWDRRKLIHQTKFDKGAEVENGRSSARQGARNKISP